MCLHTEGHTLHWAALAFNPQAFVQSSDQPQTIISLNIGMAAFNSVFFLKYKCAFLEAYLTYSNVGLKNK